MIAKKLLIKENLGFGPGHELYTTPPKWLVASPCTTSHPRKWINIDTKIQALLKLEM
jgi:hypothetical protein